MKRLLLLPILLLPATITAGGIESLAGRLLPVSHLIDSAVKYSASVRYYRGKIDRTAEEQKIQKRQWSEYIQAETAYRLGTFGTTTLSQSDGTEATLLSSEGQQSAYYYGVRVSVPLSALYNRRPRIQISKIEQQRAIAETEDRIMQVRHRILELYSEALALSQSLSIKLANLETSQLQMQKAENDFLQNKIDIQDIAAFREILSKAQVDVIRTQSKLELQLEILADMCGCSIFTEEKD